MREVQAQAHRKRRPAAEAGKLPVLRAALGKTLGDIEAPWQVLALGEGILSRKQAAVLVEKTIEQIAGAVCPNAVSATACEPSAGRFRIIRALSPLAPRQAHRGENHGADQLFNHLQASLLQLISVAWNVNAPWDRPIPKIPDDPLDKTALEQFAIGSVSARSGTGSRKPRSA